MSSLLVRLRIWYDGKFVGNNQYVEKLCLDIPEYDVFEFEEAFVHEVLGADLGCESMSRYAFKDKETGEFTFVNVDDEETDFVSLALKFVDEKKNLEILCECNTAVAEVAEVEKIADKIDDKTLEDDHDEELEDSDWELFENVVEDGTDSSDDGLEESDFSDEDDKFLEARRTKERPSKKEKIVEEKGKSILHESSTIPSTLVVLPNEDEFDSDASCESLDDDGNIKPKSKLYSKNIPFNDVKLELVMRFKDAKECQDVVRQWAVANGYNIKWTKTSYGKVEAVCAPGCNWRLYASRIHGQPTCIIKTLNVTHSCIRAQVNRQVNAKFVAAHFLPKLRNNANITVKEMIVDLEVTYGCKVRPMKCYRGKRLALEQIRGTFHDHYAKLRPYVMELMRNDKEGRFELKTFLDKQEKPVFERIYIGFSALRKGFLQGCRKYIRFDACFLKTVLGGSLLAAVSKDCNNKMYPIALAVVEKENEHSWTWFFERLFEDLNINDGLGWTFMSDKQKGLINGIQRLAPLSEHRHCARHIYANWKKNFLGPKFKVMFWNIAKANSKTEFEWCLDEMRQVNAQAAEDFMSKGPSSFCKALINSFTRTDTIDNNVCETFNSYILKSRDKPLIDMLEDIRTSIMTRIYDLSAGMEKSMDSSDLLCPNIRKKLIKIENNVRHCIVRPAVGGKFEVHHKDDAYVVDVVGKVCSCRSWELTAIPCVHALSCIFHNREDPVAYIDPFYYKSNALECYKFGLHPLPGYKAWPVVEGHPILPPQYSRPTGRPKKCRRRGLDDEQNKSNTKLSMRGLQMSCKNCGGFDHNKRTCKAPPKVNFCYEFLH
ncbi:uncharacterized protein LOC131022563 [Salvia miltiorrhiza]|uniref:uncharacterized protein LOC131022563 n=1 Tax=Salvia miltiorrhiza TaxID=226208 RepID=UPI0025AD535F|nr:uncharacterized protein LOC131022563 [Salvia miltiorrhiza]